MSYRKSTDFLHLPQYSEMDVLNVLSDFNKAMYNIDVGASTIHMIVNNVLLKGNLTEEEVEELKTRVDTLSEKSESLETTLNALSSNLEQFENSTNTNLESVEELSNANNSKIQKLNSYVPEFIHTTNVSYSLNAASENNISNPDIKIETVTYEIYRKHDIYFSFDYSTTQEISHNMELSFADITPIHELLYNTEFIGKCAVTATGYTSGGNVMPMSANIGVRLGRLVIIFTGGDNRYLPDNSHNHIKVHISGFTMRSNI